jgi:hypothetical protein
MEFAMGTSIESKPLYQELDRMPWHICLRVLAMLSLVGWAIVALPILIFFRIV